MPGEPKGRTFRAILIAVQNGLEEVGESPSKSEYDFKSVDDVDMECGSQPHFVEKLDLGADIVGRGDYEDRLADRLGIYANDVKTTESTDNSAT